MTRRNRFALTLMWAGAILVWLPIFTMDITRGPGGDYFVGTFLLVLGTLLLKKEK